MGETFPSTDAGVIIISDIVNFSLQKGNKQKELIIKLWKFLENNQFLDKPGKVLNGTGDGILIAFPNLQAPQVTHLDVVKFCKEWIKYMKTGTNKTDLRIGIHQGHFERIKLKDIKEIQAIGTGPNNCARIASIGDAGDIVVSEEFVRSWNRLENGVLKKFSPSEEDSAHLLYVKHERPQSIRVLKRPRMKTPQKIGFIEVVREMIIGQLEQVEKTFCRSFKIIDNSLSQEKLSLRVSILAPVRIDGGRFLCSTPFRYHYKNESTVKGKTKYKITGIPSGPPGQCFFINDTIILRNLPDPESSYKSYCNKLLKTNLTKKEVGDFSRKARSFICIPIGLTIHEPIAVICVDSRDPLKNIFKKNIRDIAEVIKNQYNIVLSALWKLRIHF